jgi:hypothetical protein
MRRHFRCLCDDVDMLHLVNLVEQQYRRDLYSFERYEHFYGAWISRRQCRTWMDGSPNSMDLIH